MGKSSIEWTEQTWNPVRGCTKVSPGCKHCYAETFAERWRGVKGHPYEQGFDLRLVPDKLEEPLRWKKPSMVFVNSMSDLFQDGVPEDYIRDVFFVMARAHRHTFQILTKRAERMAEVVATLQRKYNAGCEPLPNVWLGVSAEDQERWDERVQHLGRTPAAVRFVSAEPLLGPIDCGNAFDAPPDGSAYAPVDWVIVGGESGAGARPMQLAWARSIVEQCQATKVPVFVKQLGARPTCDSSELLKLNTKKGSKPEEWPAFFRVREFPRKEGR